MAAKKASFEKNRMLFCPDKYVLYVLELIVVYVHKWNEWLYESTYSYVRCTVHVYVQEVWSLYGYPLTAGRNGWELNHSHTSPASGGEGGLSFGTLP
jgi:hypothetical protein